MGAQTGPEQIEKIESYIKLAEEDDKANILTGGHRITDNGLDKATSSNQQSLNFQIIVIN